MFEIQELNDLRKRVLTAYSDVEISENDLRNGCYVVILRGGLSSDNPKAYMDSVVSDYVGHTMYNEFVEIFMEGEGRGTGTRPNM